MTLIDDFEEVEDTVKAPPAPKRKRAWLPWVSAGAVVVLLVGLVANLFVPLPIFSGKAGFDQAAQLEAQEEMCKFAPTLATYNYSNLNPYINGVLDRATGDFKSQFAKGRGELADWLRQGQVISTVQGVSCGVDASGSALKVVIGIVQGIKSIASPEQDTITTLSVVATVEKIKGKWMISNLDGPLVK